MNSSLPETTLTAHSGDAWVTAPNGEKYWGLYGAAGLLAYDPMRGILLQHRAEWTSHGGTWGLPGGAMHYNESPAAAALRECAEETGLEADTVEIVGEFISDKKVWRYTTVIARASSATKADNWNAETIEMRWVPLKEVTSYNLHPGFQETWAEVRKLLLSLITD